MALGICCADHATPYIRKKLAVNSPTSGGRSVGIVHSWAKAMEFVCFIQSEVILLNKFITKDIWFLFFQAAGGGF
jgi:hypothetical protein